MNPYYSIILVIYNHLDLTKKCLDSLFKHTLNKFESLNDFELIITDNNSTDGTAEYLREIQKQYEEKIDIKIITNDKNRWFIKPVNNAVRLARGKYIILIGSDVELCDEWLEDLTEPFIHSDDGDKVGLVGITGQACTLSANGRGYKGKRVDYIDGTFLTISREVIDRVSLNINGKPCLFDEETFINAYSEDADLSLRVVKAGYLLKRVKVDVKHNSGGTSSSEPFALFYREQNGHALMNKWGLDKDDKYQKDKDKILEETLENGGQVRMYKGDQYVTLSSKKELEEYVRNHNREYQ